MGEWGSYKSWRDEDKIRSGVVVCPNNIPSLGGVSKTFDFIHKDFRTRARHFLAGVNDGDRSSPMGQFPPSNERNWRVYARGFFNIPVLRDGSRVFESDSAWHGWGWEEKSSSHGLGAKLTPRSSFQVQLAKRMSTLSQVCKGHFLIIPNQQ